MSGNGLAILAFFVFVLYLIATDRMGPLIDALGFNRKSGL